MENVRSIAVPSWIYDHVELVLGSFGNFFCLFFSKWYMSMTKPNVIYHKAILLTICRASFSVLMANDPSRVLYFPI